tara:strand:- start:7269 stop:7505 length:237 start_codon:yes stop_codon:yes gene_type:complete
VITKKLKDELFCPQDGVLTIINTVYLLYHLARLLSLSKTITYSGSVVIHGAAILNSVPSGTDSIDIKVKSKDSNPTLS